MDTHLVATRVLVYMAFDFLDFFIEKNGDKMKNGINGIINYLMIGLFICVLLLGIYLGINKYLKYKEQERIKNAIVKIEFIDPLEVKFNSDILLSDLIKSINGDILNDFNIDTSVVGKKEIKFEYINEENIKVPYKFYVNIIDDIAPSVWLGNNYKIEKGSNKDLMDLIVCADNYDDHPKCAIIGEYDINVIGNYPLVFEAVDFSGNKTEKKFTLQVVNKISSSSSKSSSIPFRSLYNEYKKDNTKIGIDVSRWQGDIDFQKVKEENVEFVFIKVGGQNGLGKDYYIDSKFKQNIEGFKKVGIPVGLYFYSYANSVKQGREDALWVIDQIKDYEIDLPIAFDWENWSSYNRFKMSFNTLTKASEAFIDTIEKAGYQGMLYSSKNYLENAWQRKKSSVWLAHYTSKTNYNGDYVCWQRTNLAKINGITGNTVDFDICYIK